MNFTFQPGTNLISAFFTLAIALTQEEKKLNPATDRIKISPNPETNQATISVTLPFEDSFTPQGVEPVVSEYVPFTAFSAAGVQGLPNAAELPGPCATLYALAVAINKAESTKSNIPTGVGTGLDVSFDNYEITISSVFPIEFLISDGAVQSQAINYLV